MTEKNSLAYFRRGVVGKRKSLEAYFPGILPSWHQFHQYFTSSFLVRKFFAQLLSAYNLDS
jgi:hypothetical protein